MSKAIEHFSAKALFDAQKFLKNAINTPLPLTNAVDVSFQEPKIFKSYFGFLNLKSPV